MTEAQTIAELAHEAAVPAPLLLDDHDVVPTYVVPEGAQIHSVDLERFRPTPRRTNGTVLLLDAASFVPYFTRHGTSATFLYADRDRGQVTAVFNDDEDTEPGWRDHRGVLQLKRTPEWEHWAGQSGQLLTQERFAEHIEGGLPEILEPAAADMLELAQTFHAQTNSEFRSSVRLASGQRQFSFVEATDARAGKTGNLEVPETFALAIAPWVGCDRFKVTARLRYRLTAGRLLLGYLLDRPHEVLDAAFAQITDHLVEQLGATVLRGTPASPR